MKKLPKTITETLWVGIPPGHSEPTILITDMSDYGYAVLGEVEVTVDVPQVDPIEKRIEALEGQRDKARAEYSRLIGHIDDQIQRLKAIEHTPET